MGHVVNFSPMPSSAIEAQLREVRAEVVSVRDVEDDVEACRGAEVAIADFSGERRILVGHAVALASTCRLVTVPSTGIDAIDLVALRDVGIPVATARGLNATTVAEWAVWACIGGMRHLAERDLQIREGEWQQFGTRYELAGKRVLLVGMGPIGQEVARRLRGFDVELTYWTRTRRSAEVEAELDLAWTDLDGGLAEADVVVLALALSDESRHLLNVARLHAMKPTAIVVNAGRAELVDQDAMLAALDQAQLHAYATDVFPTEPPPPDDPVVAAATIATPHVAGVTVESVNRILTRTIENVNLALEGKDPLGLLDPAS